MKTILTRCDCSRIIVAKPEFSGHVFICPDCGKKTVVSLSSRQSRAIVRGALGVIVLCLIVLFSISGAIRRRLGVYATRHSGPIAVVADKLAPNIIDAKVYLDRLPKPTRDKFLDPLFLVLKTPEGETVMATRRDATYPLFLVPTPARWRGRFPGANAQWNHCEVSDNSGFSVRSSTVSPNFTVVSERDPIALIAFVPDKNPEVAATLTGSGAPIDDLRQALPSADTGEWYFFSRESSSSQFDIYRLQPGRLNRGMFEREDYLNLPGSLFDYPLGSQFRDNGGNLAGVVVEGPDGHKKIMTIKRLRELSALFDAEGQSFRKANSHTPPPPSKPETLENATTIQLAGRRLLITDNVGHRLFSYDPVEEKIIASAAFPSSAIVDVGIPKANGDIWVLDTKSKRLNLYDQDLKTVRSSLKTAGAANAFLPIDNAEGVIYSSDAGVVARKKISRDGVERYESFVVARTTRALKFAATPDFRTLFALIARDDGEKAILIVNNALDVPYVVDSLPLPTGVSATTFFVNDSGRFLIVGGNLYALDDPRQPAPVISVDDGPIIGAPDNGRLSLTSRRIYDNATKKGKPLDAFFGFVPDGPICLDERGRKIYLWSPGEKRIVAYSYSMRTDK